MKASVIISFLLFIALAILFTESCRKKNDVAGTPFQLVIPAGFPARVQFTNEPLTVEKVELGRRLFYDSKLSADGSISCASCHQQAAAFGTYDHDLSHGIGGQHGIRNAPPLFNLLWYSSFGWDGKYSSMQNVIAAHITSNIEMGETISNILGKLNNSSLYPALFKKAYGNSSITQQNLLNALAQFTATMVSASTKYDSVKQTLATFTASEQTGYLLFKSKCNSCHTEPLFSDLSYRNIGLSVTLLQDRGRMAVTGNKNDSLKFRVPSLRNLFYSFPFMHDGRFIAFSQVFDHYQNGVQQSLTLDPLLTNGIFLSISEQNALIDFLKTLGDKSFITNNRLTAPQ